MRVAPVAGAVKTVYRPCLCHRCSALQWSLLLGGAAAAANVLGGLVVVARRSGATSSSSTSSPWGRASCSPGGRLPAHAAGVDAAQQPRADAGPGRLLPRALLRAHGGPALPLRRGGPRRPDGDPAVGFSALVGLSTHTFFDGVSIASGFLVSVPLGLLIFFAVALHKIPEGFTVASIALASGRGKRGAAHRSGVLAGATLAGVLGMNRFAGGGALRAAGLHGRHTLRRRHRPDAGGERGAGHPHGPGRVPGRGALRAVRASRCPPGPAG